MVHILLSIVVVVLLIFISFKYGKNKSEMSLLTGFWESDNEFNKEAGLSLFTFYIGDKVDGKHPAYLLMMESGSHDNFLINEPASLTINTSIKNMLSNNDYQEFYILFHELETDLLPKKILAKFYPHSGKLVLSYSNKIYGVLFKNLILTEMENIKKESHNSTQVNHKMNGAGSTDTEDNDTDSDIDTTDTDDDTETDTDID